MDAVVILVILEEMRFFCVKNTMKEKNYKKNMVHEKEKKGSPCVFLLV